jgi:Protein of unknown function (DUF5672)
MLSLPDVTLVCIDTVAHELTRLALADCLRHVDFGDMLVFADRPIVTEGELKGRWIEVPRLASIAQVDEVWWYQIPRHLRTRHYLMVQWDSWILAPQRWDPDWLQYDYIGAVWPWYPTARVGNGGFSLRSSRLMMSLAHHRELFPLGYPEDQFLCRTYRPQLERQGFRWAPDEVATQFSFERGDPRQYLRLGRGPFGFHGVFNWPHVMSPDQLAERIAAANDYVKSRIEWPQMLAARMAMGYR